MADEQAFDLEKLRELIALMDEHGLTEISLSQGDQSWKLRRGGAEAVPMITAAPPPAHAAGAGGGAPPPAAPPLRPSPPLRSPRLSRSPSPASLPTAARPGAAMQLGERTWGAPPPRRGLHKACFAARRFPRHATSLFTGVSSTYTLAQNLTSPWPHCPPSPPQQ